MNSFGVGCSEICQLLEQIFTSPAGGRLIGQMCKMKIRLTLSSSTETGIGLAKGNLPRITMYIPTSKLLQNKEDKYHQAKGHLSGLQTKIDQLKYP